MSTSTRGKRPNGAEAFIKYYLSRFFFASYTGHLIYFHSCFYGCPKPALARIGIEHLVCVFNNVSSRLAAFPVFLTIVTFSPSK